MADYNSINENLRERERERERNLRHAVGRLINIATYMLLLSRSRHVA